MKNTINALSEILGNTYILYLKTQNYHWNVKGPLFASLHTMFEQQYGDLAMASDELAERIRALGARAPGSFKEFNKLAKVKEDEGSPKAEKMVKNLAEDNQTISNVIKSVIKDVQQEGDQASEDMLIARIQVHDKAAWMLRSVLGE